MEAGYAVVIPGDEPTGEDLSLGEKLPEKNSLDDKHAHQHINCHINI